MGVGVETRVMICKLKFTAAALLATLLSLFAYAQDTAKGSKESLEWPTLGSKGQTVNIETKQLSPAPVPEKPKDLSDNKWAVTVFQSSVFTEKSEVRPEVLSQKYPFVRVDGHGSVFSPTTVYYLPKENIFFIRVDCVMGHFDLPLGPFKGDPRIVLKKFQKEK